jgi:putative ABC transport system ATP-binding protein
VTPVVRLNGVTRRYGTGVTTVIAVADASLAILAGQLLGLAGPSGSGKTTLVNLVVGWEHPDDGTVERSVRPGASWAEVAVVPQELGLVDELSVRENVELPARLGRVGSIDTGELLGSLSLAELADRLPDELSLGERQRAAVARAAACRPKLLVADEPTAHQDERRADMVMAVLRDVAARGGAVLVATHDDRLLAQMDRVARMSDGRLAAGEVARDE